MFPDATCRSDIAEPKEVANLIRPILVLLWSGRLDQNRTKRGRPRGVVCRLGRCPDQKRSKPVAKYLLLFSFFNFSHSVFTSSAAFQYFVKGL